MGEVCGLGAPSSAHDVGRVPCGTLALTVCLSGFFPKGFFPVQDTGVIQGITEATQTSVVSAMSERQQALADV
ncbi:MAG: hypothetical protein IPM88_20960 [Nitrospira sp.]|nr:hypothetical protein [Nitrospira sp.]